MPSSVPTRGLGGYGEHCPLRAGTGPHAARVALGGGTGGHRARPGDAKSEPGGGGEDVSSADQLGEGPRDPEELDATAGPALGEISTGTSLGEVHLTVAELVRSVEYYTRAVGLELLEQGTGRATLGVGSRALLVLVEETGALAPFG